MCAHAPSRKTLVTQKGLEGECRDGIPSLPGLPGESQSAPRCELNEKPNSLG